MKQEGFPVNAGVRQGCVLSPNGNFSHPYTTGLCGKKGGSMSNMHSVVLT